MNIKELRLSKDLTQLQAASILGMSRRGYQELEYNNKENSRTYKNAFNILDNYKKIDEEHGIITIDQIKKACDETFYNKDVEYCILFGSYARNNANENSDVDLLISTKITGLHFFGLIEELRQKMNKKIDLINSSEILEAPELLNEILKDGKRIYGTNKR